MVNTSAPGYAYPLSSMVKNHTVLRVRCFSCRTTHYYRPEDMIQLFGDADVNGLHRKMRCEKCNDRELDVEAFQPVGEEFIGMKVRRLVAIKLLRVPVWREE